MPKLLAACHSLKLIATDGKLRGTDCADFPTMMSLISALPTRLRRLSRPHFSQHRHSSTSDIRGIYAIVNTKTCERYIGSSMNIPARFVQHQTSLRRGKHHAHRLQEAWDTYGEEAFTFVVVEEVDNAERLEELEQDYLDDEQPIYNSAAVARNRLALPPVSPERIQQVILALYDLYSVYSAVAKSPLFRSLREAISYGLIQPGPHFAVLAQAEAKGVATWDDLSAFLCSTRQESKEGEGA